MNVRKFSAVGKPEDPLTKIRRVREWASFWSDSNSLWQADFKLTERDEWMISYLDDHSRFVPGSRIHHSPTAEHAISFWKKL